MEIIFCLIGIVMFISLYDFFSAKNWQQVTSATRNDVVFENRNKKYGAYVIRRDYNKRMLLILFGLLGSVGVACAAMVAFRVNPVAEATAVPLIDESETIIMDFSKEKDDPIIETKTTAAPPATIDIAKFIPLTVVDHPVIEPKLPVDPEGEVGTKDVKGEGGFPKGPEGVEGGTGDGETKIEIPVAGPVKFPDISASYIGGRDKMNAYLSRNLVYPEGPKDLGIEAKIHIQFVVKKDGSISNIKILRGDKECYECAEEAARVIRKMQKWNPGSVNGEPVDSYFQMPINFVLD